MMSIALSEPHGEMVHGDCRGEVVSIKGVVQLALDGIACQVNLKVDHMITTRLLASMAAVCTDHAASETLHKGDRNLHSCM